MATNLYDCPACPTDCGVGTLPSVDFANCVDSVVEEESEICDIYASNIDADGNATNPPANWEDATTWADVLSQDTDGGVRHLVGIGDLPEPTQETRTISKRRKKVGTKTFTLNFDIDDLSDRNREFVRSLECGYSLAIWYTTIGGFMHGGPKGVRVTVSKANLPLQRGENSYAKGLLSFEWDATCHPMRIVNPLA